LSPTDNESRPNGSFDVVALGSVSVDDRLWVTTFPEADMKVPILRRDRSCGGVCATALAAAARLGAKAAYAGILDDSESARFVLDELNRAGVDTSNIHKYPGATPAQAVIVIDQSSRTRTIFYDVSGFVGPEYEWLPASLLSRTRVFLIDNFRLDLTMRAARAARAAGAAVLGDFENSTMPRINELVEVVDHVVVSRDFALAVTGERRAADAARQLRQNGRTAVVTCGEEGVWYADGDDHSNAKHQPAFVVDTVDTTGCGDVFHGAYAAALSRGFSLDKRILFSAAVAALWAAAKRDGYASLPRAAEVEEFLSRETFA